MHLSGDAAYFEAIQRTGGGALRPVPQPNGDDLHHFYLQMDGAVVFKHAVIAFADQIESALQRHQLKPEDVQWVVPHQANERILKAVSKRVGIPFEKFVVTIGKYGNTSAASSLHGARLGGGGGHLPLRGQDHFLRRGCRLHLRRRPADLVTGGGASPWNPAAGDGRAEPAFSVVRNCRAASPAAAMAMAGRPDAAANPKWAGCGDPALQRRGK